MTSVLGFQEVDRTDIREVGGKAANLGELSRLEGIRVPAGFCVSTEVFKRFLGAAPAIGDLLDRLALLKAEDRQAIRALAGAIRGVIEGIAIPEDVQEAITRFLVGLGEHDAYAVRSSATAEDLPAASFAGQQDTYLNVIGKPEILKHISRCWASLFTERAVAYRLQHGFDHRKVHMAVVVQKMLLPQAAGILFTADPVTGNRKVASIDAGFGLGEALVSGLVNADGYKVRDGQVIDKSIATKQLATWAVEGGGTQERALEPERRDRQVLTDAQIVRVARLGRQIEGHFGQPQDIEWCLVEDEFHIVQSRPITTLYPIPQADDRGNHVYVSVGHQQMMTDPMKPLGLSLFQLTAAARMYAAGGRLFVDPTKALASPASRAVLLDVLGRHDPLIRDALTTLIERGNFIEPSSDPKAPDPGQGKPGSMSPGGFQAQIEDDPAIVADLIARSQASIENLKRDIRTKSGTDLLDFILADVQLLKQSLTEPQSFAAIMAGMNAATWINEQMMAWLGEKNSADTLSQSAPNNVTSEMGLALLDVADVIRPHPEVVDYLLSAEPSKGSAPPAKLRAEQARRLRTRQSAEPSKGSAPPAKLRAEQARRLRTRQSAEPSKGSAPPAKLRAEQARRLRTRQSAEPSRGSAPPAKLRAEQARRLRTRQSAEPSKGSAPPAKLRAEQARRLRTRQSAEPSRGSAPPAKLRAEQARRLRTRQSEDDGLLEGLLPLEGGSEAHDALRAYLDRYGMRCAGEIDVTRTRWREAPTTLVPLILSNVKNFEPGAGRRKFEQGRQGAAKKEQELLERLKQLPEGEKKAGETQRMISRLRTFIGYREYPKYGIVSRYYVYKQALLEEAGRLVRANVLTEPEDIYYLTFQELHEVVRTQKLDDQIISKRKAEHERHWKLIPPRVLTSDGEIVAGAYKRGDIPAGALVGLPVSAGVVEGRARVLSDMADAELEAGDILVTAFTDPSWTPLFVSIKGLVTEVGGLMTHGAVIAREYGLPAVVGVENATTLIKDRQRIRVHGTDGFVEILA